MVFNGDADDQDLCSLADELAGSNDISYPLKSKARNANWGLRKLLKVIWQAYGGWIFDDSNNAGEPEAISELTANTRFFAFATAQMIHGMEAKDSAGNWRPLKPITLEQIQAKGSAETEFEKTASSAGPRWYRPVKNGVNVYPSSSVTIATALKAKISKDISPFTSASTATAPGIDSSCHEALAVFMALRHAKNKGLTPAASLAADWEDEKRDVKMHYAQKFRENFPAGLRRTGNYAGQFE